MGDEESSSTRIRVLDSSDQPFSYDSSSQYIGTLEPNQSGTAVFEVKTDTDATAKEYLIDFEVRGVKGSEVFVEDSTVEASVSNGDEGFSPVLPIIALLVILGLVGFIFRDRIKSRFNSEE